MLAGPLVNIVVGMLIYFILIWVKYNLQIAMSSTVGFFGALIDSIKIMVTGGMGIDDLAGPVGIGVIVSKASGVADFIYLIAVISLSLGISNLIPIPPLDGGKLLIYIVEWIKRKPLKEETTLKIQMMGFAFIIGLSVFIMYNDVAKLFH